MGLAAVAALQACTTHNCQTTCRHVYEASECDINQAGRTDDEAISDCVATCESALQHPGGLCAPDPETGEEECYDPHLRYPANDRPVLQTDQQAAAWIDCVWEYAPSLGSQSGCSNIDPLDGGFCAPI